MRFNLADGTSAGLDVRRAVAEFVTEPDKYDKEPDITLAKSGEIWAKVSLSQATPEHPLDSGAVRVDGDAAEAVRVLNLFDRYKPEKAVVIPPAYLEHRL